MSNLSPQEAAGLPNAANDDLSLGKLPVWDLADLYAGPDAPEVSRDFRRAEEAAQTFAANFRGRVEEIASSPRGGDVLASMIETYETIEDLLGRLISYAGLLYAGNSVDPARAKFYGDTQERVTAISTELLFFTLELNRIEDSDCTGQTDPDGCREILDGLGGRGG